MNKVGRSHVGRFPLRRGSDEESAEMSLLGKGVEEKTAEQKTKEGSASAATMCGKRRKVSSGEGRGDYCCLLGGQPWEETRRWLVGWRSKISLQRTFFLQKNNETGIPCIPFWTAGIFFCVVHHSKSSATLFSFPPKKNHRKEAEPLIWGFLAEPGIG